MTVRRLVTTLLLVVPLSLVATAAPGWARDATVVATTPADGAALDVAPAEVVLTTAGRPDVGRSHLSVRDGRGENADGGAIHSGQPGSLALPVRITGPGIYTAAYHVVLTDGRESIGVVRFSVGTGVAPPTPPVLPAAAAAAHAGHDHGVDGLGATLLAIDALVLAGAVLMLRLRPAPHRG